MIVGKQHPAQQYTMSHMSSNVKLKCAQLQIPNERCKAVASGTSSTDIRRDAKVGSSVSKCFRNLFEENLDKLREYIAITNHYHFKVRSFSTSDIFEHVNNELECTCSKKYLSECDLAAYSKHHSGKESSNEYITYSCSTLAICGDTMHSSQLPSPQTQSIRQINSFIFSDLDLIKSVNKKVRNTYIQQRMTELVKSINLSLLQDSELETITKLSSNVIVKPIRMNYDKDNKFATESGDILIHVVDCEADKDKSHCVTKHDKEMFVLNWLQTVETCPADQE